MKDKKIPVLLTAEQITALQDIILEKQYQLAAAQTDNLQTTDFGRLNEQMSHTTDLLLALATAQPDAVQPEAHETAEIPESA